MLGLKTHDACASSLSVPGCFCYHFKNMSSSLRSHLGPQLNTSLAMTGNAAARQLTKDKVHEGQREKTCIVS